MFDIHDWFLYQVILNDLKLELPIIIYKIHLINCYKISIFEHHTIKIEFIWFIGL